MKLCAIMVVDYALAWGAELVMKYFFADNQPKAICDRRVDQMVVEGEREKVE